MFAVALPCAAVIPPVTCLTLEYIQHTRTHQKNIWCYLVLHWTHQKTPFQSFHHNLPPPSLLSHNILTRVPTWDTILLCHMRQCTEHFCQVMSYSKEVVLGETNLTFQVNILKNSHGPLFFANHHQPFPLLVKTPLFPCSLFQPPLTLGIGS